ncbi:MAG: HDOD domain-containing protein [Burkholderiales bacterium]
MAVLPIERKRVIELSDALASFPRTVSEILATIDDPDGNLNVLVGCINHDPIIAARVLSVANRAAARARRDTDVTDIYTATSLIGMTRVREITLISALKAFVGKMISDEGGVRQWQHSVAVGVCCEEIAAHVEAPISVDSSLIAGLLHDIGQFWFQAIEPATFRACRLEARARNVGIEQVERAHFGVDHSTVGRWLAEHWELPDDICAAIGGHHAPDSAADSFMVPLVHVAEVLSNALELSGGGDANHVSYVSSAACRKLGLVWGEDSQSLFGRIEARAQHANAFFSA